MQKLKIVRSNIEPDTNVLWLKSDENGMQLLIFNNGEWVPAIQGGSESFTMSDLWYVNKE